MQNQLPGRADPWRLAADAAQFSGELKLAELSRLSALVRDNGDDRAVVKFRLGFGHDSAGRAVVRGTAATALQRECQRCLRPLTERLEVDFQLGLVATEDEIEGLPAALDPLLVTDAPFRPAEVIEDELLLALAAVPLHPAPECAPDWRHDSNLAAASAAGSQERYRPFAGLAGQMKKGAAK